MTAKIPGLELPQGATTRVRGQATAPVPITAFGALTKVNKFVVMEITSQMRGQTPEFMDGARPCWSVPAVLTSPTRGVVGTVGEIRVDATTGELLVDEALIQRMRQDARTLAERSPL